ETVFLSKRKMVSHYAPPSRHLPPLHPLELDNYDKSDDGEADEVGDVAGDYHAQSAGDEQHALEDVALVLHEARKAAGHGVHADQRRDHVADDVDDADVNHQHGGVEDEDVRHDKSA